MEEGRDPHRNFGCQPERRGILAGVEDRVKERSPPGTRPWRGKPVEFPESVDRVRRGSRREVREVLDLALSFDSTPGTSDVGGLEAPGSSWGGPGSSGGTEGGSGGDFRRSGRGRGRDVSMITQSPTTPIRNNQTTPPLSALLSQIAS